MENIGKFAQEILLEMEKRGFTQGEAELLPKLLSEQLEENSKRFEYHKPELADVRNKGTNEKEKKVAYLCDGRHCCNNSENCYVNGGECHHTKDIKHAKYFREWRNTYEEMLPDVTGQHSL